VWKRVLLRFFCFGHAAKTKWHIEAILTEKLYGTFWHLAIKIRCQDIFGKYLILLGAEVGTIKIR